MNDTREGASPLPVSNNSDGFPLSQWRLNLDQLRKWTNLVTNTLKCVQNMMPGDYPCK